MDTLVFFSFSVLFLVMSIQLFRNKWLMLIAGYNTMPKDDRDKIEIRPYAIALQSLWQLPVYLCVFMALIR